MRLSRGGGGGGAGEKCHFSGEQGEMLNILEFGSIYLIWRRWGARQEIIFHSPVFDRIPGGGRVVRRCWVNFQCRGVLQF